MLVITGDDLKEGGPGTLGLEWFNDGYWGLKPVANTATN